MSNPNTSGQASYINGLVSNGTTFTLAGDMGGRPSEPPKGLLSTNAVQTMRGWVGQVIIAQSIVFETEAQEDAEVAINLANERIIGVFTELFMKQVGDA